MSGMNGNAQACRRMYREEDWIDWLLGYKPPEEHAAMAEHRSACRKCAATAAEWQPLLAGGAAAEAGAESARDWAPMPGDGTPGALPGVSGVEASSASATAWSAAASRTASSGAPMPTAPMPSESVRRSLRAHVRTRGLWSRVAGGIRRRRSWAAAGAAAAVLLLCLAGLYRTVNEPKEQRDRYVAAHEPGAVRFLNDPRTASYKVHAFNDDLGDGYVWFNDSSQEVLVLLEGMLPSDDHVLQAWAVRGGGHANLGLLRHDETSRAHFYFKGEALAKVDNIALTVEPSGGSRAPTSPDAIVFRLQHR